MRRMKNIHPQDWQKIRNRLQAAGWFLQDRLDYYRNTEEGREDLAQAAHQTARAAGGAAGILWAAANGVVRGGIRRVRDYCDIGRCTVRGEYREAGKSFMHMEKRRFHSAGQLAIGTARTAGDGAMLVYGHFRKKGSDVKRVRRFRHGLRNCAIAGAAILIGMEAYDVLEHETIAGAVDGADGLVPEVSVEHLDGVQDGMLVDDSPANLHELAVSGELGHTEHISDVIRDDAARTEFLQMHGFTAAPPGYEVHHVVPLSEGGADSPDNMVLLRAEDHDWITMQHERFYGWDPFWHQQE